EKEHMKPNPPLPEDWYKTCDFISDKNEEPTPYKLFFDFMIVGYTDSFANVMTSSMGGTVFQKMMSMMTNMPPMTLLIESAHTKRGLEYVRISMMPFGILEGPPEPGSCKEPDIIMSMEYYDLVRLLTGEIENFIDPFCDGLASIEGNLVALAEFEDVFEVFETMFGMKEEEEAKK
ncbi:MAG: hypothetical protein SVM80_10345, partial [Halobacteriota archaeon]|nr:hypothetical protein [Halobacteriota archaeon]